MRRCRFSGDLGEVLPAVDAIRDVAHSAGFAGKFDQFRVVGKAGATHGKTRIRPKTARDPFGKNLDAKPREGLISHEKIQERQIGGHRRRSGARASGCSEGRYWAHC